MGCRDIHPGRYLSMRKLSVILMATVVAAMVPMAASAGTATYVTYNCKATKMQPKSILVACADANYRVNHLDWSSWGVKQAVGRGVFHFNDCDPDCAGGTFHSRAGSLTLSKRLWCPDIERYVFKHGTAVYDKPWQGKTTYQLYLSCPF
jgi:hypothetical protein